MTDAFNKTLFSFLIFICTLNCFSEESKDLSPKKTKSCAIAYDPKGFGSYPMVAGLLNALNDNDCDEFIFFPPHPFFSPVTYDKNGKAELQRVKREDSFIYQIKNDIRKLNAKDPLKGRIYTPADYVDFNNKLKKTGGVDKSIFLFHGSPGFAGMISDESFYAESFFRDNEKFTKRTMGILSNSNPDVEAELTKKLEAFSKSINYSGKDFPNPCYQEAIDLKNAESGYRLEKGKLDLPIIQFVKSKVNQQKNNQSQVIDCKDYSTFQKLMTDYLKGKKPEDYCQKTKDYVSAQVKFSTCKYGFLNSNLLDKAPLSGAKINSNNLILSCAIGSDSFLPVIDSFGSDLLAGCDHEFESYKNELLSNRKNSSTEVSAKICNGAPDGSKFTVGLNLTLANVPIINDPGSIIPKNGHPFFDSPDVIEAQILFNQVSGFCNKNLFESFKYKQKYMNDDGFFSIPDAEHENLKAFFKGKLCENDMLDPDSQIQLKSALIHFHTETLWRRWELAQMYGSRNTINNSLDEQMQSVMRLKSKYSIFSRVKASYEGLKMNSRADQENALARLNYLMDEYQSSVGFFDCYVCRGGNSEKIGCDDLKKAYDHLSFIGDKKSYDLINDLPLFMKELDTNASVAAKAPPLLCKKEMPYCEVGSGDKCLQSDNKISDNNLGQNNQKTIKPKFKKKFGPHK